MQYPENHLPREFLTALMMRSRGVGFDSLGRNLDESPD